MYIHLLNYFCHKTLQMLKKKCNKRFMGTVYYILHVLQDTSLVHVQSHTLHVKTGWFIMHDIHNKSSWDANLF